MNTFSLSRCCALTLLAGLMAWQPAAAQEEPKGVFTPSKPSGFLVWNPNPQPVEEAHWTGGCRDGKADGTGTMVWVVEGKPSSTYAGAMQGGYEHGKGRISYDDGDAAEGDWVKGELHGKGMQTFSSGNRYEGEYVNGEFEGMGTYTWEDGDRYEGQWVKGNRQGKGTYYGNDGSVYTGDYLNDVRHGHGVYTLEDGDKYTGEFRDGEIHGQGVYKFANGDSYEGRFEEGRINGFGTRTIHRANYVKRDRSPKGYWDGNVFVEKGLFQDNVLMKACKKGVPCAFESKS